MMDVTQIYGTDLKYSFQIYKHICILGNTGKTRHQFRLKDDYRQIVIINKCQASLISDWDSSREKLIHNMKYAIK